ncbi:hypothetical protein GGTG_06832 [Gaeumannomyces tritici R3-111a-1]|uniref:Uncharacterized protein n=1 Tax=Gaeumannomyces tritici (strain R3-111a-1) TaxID=644352 RepID=J3NZY5_GAET3|nr:hypothetical protein GGTG_06832 [Gaeumannomyces tritici R3-111a-1]EJT76918.1 hypothetical protein GGTG_06832 [Gaeumannomyces tritici R3-111a-1]
MSVEDSGCHPYFIQLLPVRDCALPGGALSESTPALSSATASQPELPPRNRRGSGEGEGAALCTERTVGCNGAGAGG